LLPALMIALIAPVAPPAQAALNGPTTPPPTGCTPVPLSRVAPLSAVCVHRVLVTEARNTEEQNHTLFTVTDHSRSVQARVPNWWPSGAPVAGMVITMWGKLTNGVFLVDRWLDLAHGTGPSPAGPYGQTRLLDAASGRLPEHRMTWVRATTFLLDPQDTGDGDIHVQTFSGCPSAGLTTETTPPMRGYVDHPASPGDTRSRDTSDGASNHLEDGPPVGVPVMILGATRYDYGFGWWEIHPIRAWRYLTPSEAADQAAECGGDPTPHLDPSAPVPVPFGFPPCTDGSEFGNAPGFNSCGPQCYVARTVIDRPEELAGPCAGITPIVARSQEGLPETTPGKTGISATFTPSGIPRRRGSKKRSRRAQLRVLERVYGRRCGALRRAHGRHSRPYGRCLVAMARLAGGETHSARFACRYQSRHRGRHRRRSDFAECVRAGRALLRNRHRERD
jgi:hypothetical protein